jgi:tetratricopeptide (TPR) repeat protein
MWRYTTFIGLLLLAVAAPLKATTIRGAIRENHAGGRAIANAEVSAIGLAHSRPSHADGTFVLEFPNKQPGERVQLFVNMPGMVVINFHDMALNLPMDASAAPVILLLCTEADRQEMTRLHYGGRNDAREQHHQKEIAALQAKLRAKQAEAKQLKVAHDRVQERERNAQEELARTKELVDLKVKAEAMNTETKQPRFQDRLQEEAQDWREALARAKAIEVRDSFKQGTSNVYRSDASMALNTLAIRYWRANRIEEAQQIFGDALEISRKLAEHNPSIYLSDVADTLSNRGHMLSDQNRIAEARRDHDGALTLRRDLAANNPTIFQPALAATLLDLAELLRSHNPKGAHEANVEALKLYRHLVKSNPTTYRPRLAQTLAHLGTLNHDQNQARDAELAFEEALDNYDALETQNPGQYVQHLESTRNLLSELYAELLDVHRKKAQQNPGLYLPYLAARLVKVGMLSRGQGRMDEARSAFREALDIYVALQRKTNPTLDPKNTQFEPLVLSTQRQLNESTDRRSP